MNIVNLTLRLSSPLIYVFAAAYVIFFIAISIVDKKKIKIDKKILTGGVVMSIIYMLYLYTLRAASIKWNIIYLGIYAILLAADTFILRRYAKDSYIIKILMLLNIIWIYVDTQMTIYTLMIAALATAIYIFLLSVEKKRKGNKRIRIEEVPVGYFIGASNLIALFIITFLTVWSF